MCTQIQALPSARSIPGMASGRVVAELMPNTRTTGRTNAPRTLTPYWRSAQSAHSTATHTATDTASLRLPSGGRPSRKATPRSATVWRTQPAIVATEARRWSHSSRWTGVPADPPVELLDVRLALPARGDEVAFLLLVGLQTNEVLRGLRTAERATQARKDPGPTAHVAREPTPAGVGEVTEPRRRAAEGTDAEIPRPLGEMDPASGEVPIERWT